MIKFKFGEKTCTSRLLITEFQMTKTGSQLTIQRFINIWLCNMYRREERGTWNWCKGSLLMILKTSAFLCRAPILSLSMIMYKRASLSTMLCSWLLYKIAHGLKLLNSHTHNDIYKDMNIINIHTSLECLGLRKWGFSWRALFFCPPATIAFSIIWALWDKDYYFLSFKEYISGSIYIHIFLSFSTNIPLGDELIETSKTK